MTTLESRPLAVPMPGGLPDLQLRSSEQGTSMLIVLTWAGVMLPALTQSLTEPKVRVFAADDTGLNVLASLVNIACTFGLLLLLLVLLVRGVAHIPTDRRGVLLVLLLPWLYQVTRDLYAGGAPQLGALIYPLVVLVVWLHRPRLQQLEVLGWLVGATAVVSVLMGWFLPDRGILLNATTGAVVTPTKELLSSGILIGPLTDGNPLGQFIALGLPAVAFVRYAWARPAIFVIATYAVVWTSNRSSLAAIGLGLLLAVGLRAVPRDVRRQVVVLLLGALVAVVVVLPLTTRDNTAWTNRGYIWNASQRFWHDNPIAGLGSRFYQVSADFSNNIGPTAYHGHNQFVQTLVLGGLINLVLIGALMLVAVRACARWAAEQHLWMPTCFLAMVLLSSTFEITISLARRGTLLPIVVIPLVYVCLARDGRPGRFDDRPRLGTDKEVTPIPAGTAVLPRRRPEFGLRGTEGASGSDLPQFSEEDFDPAVDLPGPTFGMPGARPVPGRAPEELSGIPAEISSPPTGSVELIEPEAPSTMSLSMIGLGRLRRLSAEASEAAQVRPRAPRRGPGPPPDGES